MLYIELGVLCATTINYRAFVSMEANRLLKAILSVSFCKFLMGLGGGARIMHFNFRRQMKWTSCGQGGRRMPSME